MAVQSRITITLLLAVLLTACAPKGPPPSALPEAVVAPPASSAEQALADSAGSLDVSLRRRALYLLVRTSPAPAGGEWGLRGLWDPNPWVRRAVIDALAERLPEPESQQRLLEFAQREGIDDDSRCAAAGRLARAGDARALPAVQAAVAGAGARWKAAPCALAAAQMGDAAAQALLADALQRGEIPLDSAFLRDVGRSGLPALADPLAAAADAVEEPLLPPLAAALLDLGDPRGEALFERLLSGGGDLAWEAFALLQDHPGPQVPALLRKADGDDDLRAAAELAAIGRGKGDPTPAIQALGAQHRDTRALGAWALGGWLAAGDGPGRLRKIVVQALQFALQDRDEMVRAAAAQAAGRSGEGWAAAALAPLLGDASPVVRVEAAGALQMLQGSVARAAAAGRDPR